MDFCIRNSLIKTIDALFKLSWTWKRKNTCKKKTGTNYIKLLNVF